MDGDPVEEPSEPITITEFFMRMFPLYMAMGMSYDEYWNMDPWLVVAYRKAHKMRVEQSNWEMWMIDYWFIAEQLAYYHSI